MTRESNAKNSVSSATDRYREADFCLPRARGHLGGQRQCLRVDIFPDLLLHEETAGCGDVYGVGAVGGAQLQHDVFEVGFYGGL
jgi:hypothetical protein